MEPYFQDQNGTIMTVDQVRQLCPNFQISDELGNENVYVMNPNGIDYQPHEQVLFDSSTGQPIQLGYHPGNAQCQQPQIIAVVQQDVTETCGPTMENMETQTVPMSGHQIIYHQQDQLERLAQQQQQQHQLQQQLQLEQQQRQQLIHEHQVQQQMEQQQRLQQQLHPDQQRLQLQEQQSLQQQMQQKLQEQIQQHFREQELRQQQEQQQHQQEQQKMQQIQQTQQKMQQEQKLQVQQKLQEQQKIQQMQQEQQKIAHLQQQHLQHGQVQYYTESNGFVTTNQEAVQMRLESQSLNTLQEEVRSATFVPAGTQLLIPAANVLSLPGGRKIPLRDWRKTTTVMTQPTNQVSTIQSTANHVATIQMSVPSNQVSTIQSTISNHVSTIHSPANPMASNHISDGTSVITPLRPGILHRPVQQRPSFSYRSATPAPRQPVLMESTPRRPTSLPVAKRAPVARRSAGRGGRRCAIDDLTERELQLEAERTAQYILNTHRQSEAAKRAQHTPQRSVIRHHQPAPQHRPVDQRLVQNQTHMVRAPAPPPPPRDESTNIMIILPNGTSLTVDNPHRLSIPEVLKQIGISTDNFQVMDSHEHLMAQTQHAPEEYVPPQPIPEEQCPPSEESQPIPEEPPSARENGKEEKGQETVITSAGKKTTLTPSLEEQKRVATTAAEPPIEATPVKKEYVPQLVPGMLAVCGACGYSSVDFNLCQRCRRALPADCKRVSSAERRKPAQVVKEEAPQEMVLVPLSTPGKTLPPVFVEVASPRVRKTPRPPTRRLKTKQPEEPVLLTLSSDDEAAEADAAPEPLLFSSPGMMAASMSTVSHSLGKKEPPIPAAESSCEKCGGMKQAAGNLNGNMIKSIVPSTFYKSSSQSVKPLNKGPPIQVKNNPIARSKAPSLLEGIDLPKDFHVNKCKRKQYASPRVAPSKPEEQSRPVKTDKGIDLPKAFHVNKCKRKQYASPRVAPSKPEKQSRPVKTDDAGEHDEELEKIMDGSDGGPFVVLECRTVRIGSYKVVPADKVLISAKGIKMVVPHLDDESSRVNVILPTCEIQKVLMHFGKQMPVMFVYAKPCAAIRFCAQLKMNVKNGHFYSPLGKEVNRRITILPMRIPEETKILMKNILPAEILTELSHAEANDILIRASPTHQSATAGVPGAVKQVRPEVRQCWAEIAKVKIMAAIKKICQVREKRKKKKKGDALVEGEGDVEKEEKVKKTRKKRKGMEVCINEIEDAMDTVATELIEDEIDSVKKVKKAGRPKKVNGAKAGRPKKAKGAKAGRPKKAVQLPLCDARSPYRTRQAVLMERMRRIMVYPPPPETGGISINTEDYSCLGAMQFLNDVIIDFYLKYLTLSVLSPADRKRTHIFSTFFYKRLTTRPKKNKKSTIEEDPKLTAAEKRHFRVRSWTKKVNLFEKDFIIIPINEHSHWFLAIICYPGLTGPVRMSDESPVAVESAPAARRVSERPTRPPVKLEPGEIRPIPLDMTAEGSDRDEADEEEEDLEQSDDEEAAAPGEPVEAPVEAQAPVAPPDSPTTPTPKVKTRSRTVQEPIKQPCILIFDSLAGAMRHRIVATLRDYLRIEYKAKMKIDREFNKDTIKGASPKVPQQNNFYDCGLYVLQYVESFFQRPIRDYRLPMRELAAWFDDETVNRKREELAALLLRLMTENNVNIDALQLPTLSFQVLDDTPPDEADAVLHPTETIFTREAIVNDFIEEEPTEFSSVTTVEVPCGNHQEEEDDEEEDQNLFKKFPNLKRLVPNQDLLHTKAKRIRSVREVSE